MEEELNTFEWAKKCHEDQPQEEYTPDLSLTYYVRKSFNEPFKPTVFKSVEEIQELLRDGYDIQTNPPDKIWVISGDDLPKRKLSPAEIRAEEERQAQVIEESNRSHLEWFNSIMTVSELITELQKYDGNMKVIGYSECAEEDFGIQVVAEDTTDDEGTSYYCQAESVLYGIPNQKVLVLTDHTKRYEDDDD